MDLTADRALAATEVLDATCQITRAAAPGDDWDPALDFDPVSGTHATTVADTVIWEGACAVTARSARDVDRGGDRQVHHTHVLKVPVEGTEAIRPGDTATITGITEGRGDPGLLAARLVIADQPVDSSVILRRVACELVTDAGTPE